MDSTLSITSWLHTLPIEFIHVVATRAALRAVPAQTYHVENLKKTPEEYYLNKWREGFPKHATILASLIIANRSGEKIDYQPFSDWSELNSLPCFYPTAYAAATLYSDVVYKNDPSAGREAAKDYSGRACSDSVFQVSIEARHYESESMNSIDLYSVFIWEKELIDSGISARTLLDKSLWPDDFDFSASYLGKSWENLADYLVSKNKSWSQWIDFYERVMQGRTPDNIDLPRLVPKKIS